MPISAVVWSALVDCRGGGFSGRTVSLLSRRVQGGQRARFHNGQGEKKAVTGGGLCAYDIFHANRSERGRMEERIEMMHYKP